MFSVFFPVSLLAQGLLKTFTRKPFGKFKLHPGLLFLYFRDGGLRVLADIDNVFHKCMMG